MDNGLFDKMVSEAMEEVANKGWKVANQNAVTLTAFGMLCKLVTNRLHRVTRPFWWTAGVIGAGVIWYVVSSMLGL